MPRTKGSYDRSVVITVRHGCVDIVKKPKGISIQLLDMDIHNPIDDDLCHCGLSGVREMHYHCIDKRYRKSFVMAGVKRDP